MFIYFGLLQICLENKCLGENNPLNIIVSQKKPKKKKKLIWKTVGMAFLDTEQRQN